MTNRFETLFMKYALCASYLEVTNCFLLFPFYSWFSR